VRRGYACVIQRARGGHDMSRTQTGPIEGAVSTPPEIDFTDGLDLSNWIVDQCWSNGAIGAIGASAEGWTALAAAVDNNPWTSTEDMFAEVVRSMLRGALIGAGVPAR